jgi:uncharacterized membrane protein YcjF (UPF0283 family)
VVEDQSQHDTKGSNEAVEQALKPKQSYWPIVLAASLTLTLVGVILMSYPIVFWVGMAFVIASFIGWGIERH